MNIIQILKDKHTENPEQTSKDLGVPSKTIMEFISGKKAPWFDICQKILDLWSYEKTPITYDDEGHEIKVTHEDGTSNISFVPRGKWSERWGAKPPWEGKDVCLCLPMYKEVPQETVISLIALAMRYKDMIRIEQRGGDSMITRSRNQLAKRFLKTGASWSIWLDDDMIFPIGSASIFSTWMNDTNITHNVANHHVIERLISWGKTIVGGCYWDRKGGGRLICGGSSPILNPIPSDNLYAANFIGTGCLAIHRSVFEDIAKKFPETMTEESFGNECGFFTNIQNQNRMMGEDESFGWRAKEAGHTSYLDLGLVLGHVGSTIHGMPKNGSRI